MTDNGHRRSIRSYVIRGGRMTPAQQRAFDAGWQRWGVKHASGMIDPEALFGRSAPLTLEIGFGMGQSLAEMAEQQPRSDFIGIEVHRPGVGKLFHTLEKLSLENVRVFCHDAVEVLQDCIPSDSLDVIQIYFPDPWHKKKHHKRRLIQPDFVELARSRLRVGGTLHLATDWENYAEHMLLVLQQAAGMENTRRDGGYAPRPPTRPLTRFEERGQRLGHGVWDLVFRRTLA